MGTLSIGDQFGPHHLMAGFATKLHRFGKMVGLVTAHRRQQQNEGGADQERAKRLPTLRQAEINLKRWPQTGPLHRLATANQNSSQPESQSNHHKPWRYHVSQDAQVRI